MNAHVIQVQVAYMPSKIDESCASRFLHRSYRSLAPLSFLLCLHLCHPKLLQIRWYFSCEINKHKCDMNFMREKFQRNLAGQILIIPLLSALYQTSEEISLRYFSIHPEYRTYFRFSSSLKCFQIKIEINLQISRHFELFNHLFKSLTDNTS